jgi:Flp pilus assembly protein TadB
MSLLIPILVAAVLVFVVSSIIHMMLKYHESDFGQVPSEDAVMDAMRPFNIPPGDYVIPRAESSQAMKSPEFQEKCNKGPIAFMTVLPSGSMGMGSSLVQWFIYCIVVGLIAAYIAGRALAPGAEYLAVFRFAGATAFVGYALALLQNSIWYKRAWSSTLKSVFDGLVYALVTAGVFGWLWPAA